jgi:putative ABC transport system permease protein
MIISMNEGTNRMSGIFLIQRLSGFDTDLFYKLLFPCKSLLFFPACNWVVGIDQTSDMISHYIKIALRNLSKQKVLAFINVFGLSVGIACFSLFLLYALNEFSYDQFHKNGADIYRVVQWFAGDKNRGPGGDASSNTPTGPAMKQDLPGVENFVRLQDGWGEHFVKVDDKITRQAVSFADPQILKVFSFGLIAGNPDDALKDPHNVVLTRDKAMQLFGTTDNIIGRRIDIKMNDQQDQFEGFRVGGVVENIPKTSSIQFGLLGNFEYVLATDGGKQSATNWHMTIGIETYVLLKGGNRLANNPKLLAGFWHKYYSEDEAFLKKSGRWNGIDPFPYSYKLQPIQDIHTSMNVDSGPPGSTTNPKNLWILISISAGILLIACINFTTLAIGRSAGRAKEVGVRKVIGAERKKLIYQFLTEAMVLSIFSGAIGLLLANGLLPFFNKLCGRQLSFSADQFPQLFWILAGVVLLVGLIAGSYPALVLSGFKPVEVLKSKIKLGGSNYFTKSLVTFQFVLSVGLIISTLVIFKQLHFLRSKNLGLTKENVLVINADGLDTKKMYPLFRHLLQSRREIVGIAGSQIGLGEGQGQMGGGYKYGDKDFGSIEYPIDQYYLKVMGMQLIAGRNFNLSIAGDSTNAVIINETLTKNILGTSPENAIGKQFNGRGDQIKTVIGVTRDFNFESLNRAVREQLFNMPGNFAPGKIFVRIQAGEPAGAIALLESAWKKLEPDYPFKYSFLDEDLDRFYKSEEKWSSIVGWAGGISIFLACLGLFGLAALAAVNRTREIGIRKVLGASVPVIVRMLSKDFLILVTIALLIASPIAWYFMNRWLQDYAYRINITWWIFAVTGFVTIFIAFLTIGVQALKVAISNPVESLRNE